MENLVYNQIQEEKLKADISTRTLDVFSVLAPMTDQFKTSVNSEQLTFLQYNRDVFNSLSSYISFVVPLKNQNVYLELVETTSSFSDYRVVTSDGNSYPANKKIRHYQGIVQNDENSIVAITFLEDQVMGLIATDDGNVNIALDIDLSCHLLYNDKDFSNTAKFNCHTDADNPLPYDKEILLRDSKLIYNEGSKRVGFYIETQFDIFQAKGSVSAVESYVAGLLNQVGLLYLNENILTGISEIYVWNTPDPYTGLDTATLLTQFKNHTSSMNGDLGHLLTFREIGGGRAAAIPGLCNSNIDDRLAVSSVDSFFPTVPNYSWSVMVITHEFGHLLGSRHTHACVWNGNNTAIDGCALPEGNCSPGPMPPAGGGTIMSYCHNQPSVGINFNLGFGPQPGNVIRNTVKSAGCLPPFFSINGPNEFCSSGTFSLNNVPTGATVSWSVTPSGIVNLFPSGNSLNLTRITDGDISIYATITIGSASFAARNKEVRVGSIPVIPAFISSGQFSSFADPYNLLGIVYAPPGNRTVVLNFYGVQNLSATVISGGNYPQVVGTTVYWQYPEYGSGFILLFQYDVSCGRVSQRISFQNSSPYRYVIEHDRVSNQLTIDHDLIDTFKKEIENPKIVEHIYSVDVEEALLNERKKFYEDNISKSINFRLLDSEGNIITEKQSSGGDLKTSLSIEDVQPGTYYLHITRNNDLKTEEVAIR